MCDRDFYIFKLQICGYAFDELQWHNKVADNDAK